MSTPVSVFPSSISILEGWPRKPRRILGRKADARDAGGPHIVSLRPREYSCRHHGCRPSRSTRLRPRPSRRVSCALPLVPAGRLSARHAGGGLPRSHVHRASRRSSGLSPRSALASMALTAFQRAVIRLLASRRVEAGESYLAGGAALNTLTASARLSRDIDFFHDTAEAVTGAVAADREILATHGYEFQALRERAGYAEATVARGAESVEIQWTTDSAFRFFPLVRHEELGLVLHPFDLATNKVLALVGRLEARDWIDVIASHERIQRLGYLARRQHPRGAASDSIAHPRAVPTARAPPGSSARTGRRSSRGRSGARRSSARGGRRRTSGARP